MGPGAWLLPQSLSSDEKIISSSEISFCRFWVEFVGWIWVAAMWSPVSSSSEIWESFFMMASFSFWSFIPPSLVFDFFRAIDGSNPSFGVLLGGKLEISSA